jgi:hypothetical protein
MSLSTKYARWSALQSKLCIYCGQWATTVDHFPPQSLYHAGWLLPVCFECNVLAGTVLPLNFKKRCAHVRNRLRQRNKRFLYAPVWDDEDLIELGPNLKKEITLCQQKKNIARARIAWNVEAHLACIDKSKDFARFVAAISTMESEENKP